MIVGRDKWFLIIGVEGARQEKQGLKPERYRSLKDTVPLEGARTSFLGPRITNPSVKHEASPREAGCAGERSRDGPVHRVAIRVAEDCGQWEGMDSDRSLPYPAPWECCLQRSGRTGVNLVLLFQGEPETQIYE